LCGIWPIRATHRLWSLRVGAERDNGQVSCAGHHAPHLPGVTSHMDEVMLPFPWIEHVSSPKIHGKCAGIRPIATIGI
jgi:hypothetical protein